MESVWFRAFSQTEKFWVGRLEKVVRQLHIESTIWIWGMQRDLCLTRERSDANSSLKQISSKNYDQFFTRVVSWSVIFGPILFSGSLHSTILYTFSLGTFPDTDPPLQRGGCSRGSVPITALVSYQVKPTLACLKLSLKRNKTIPLVLPDQAFLRTHKTIKLFSSAFLVRIVNILPSIQTNIFGPHNISHILWSTLIMTIMLYFCFLLPGSRYYTEKKPLYHSTLYRMP